MPYQIASCQSPSPLVYESAPRIKAKGSEEEFGWANKRVELESHSESALGCCVLKGGVMPASKQYYFIRPKTKTESSRLFHPNKGKEGLVMKTVKDLVDAKTRKEIWSVTPETLVYRALQLLSEKGIGALLVMEKGELVGIISERDYARKVILEGKSSKETYTKEVMSKTLYVLTPENTIEECMALMTEKRVRHLPVIDRGTKQVLSVISIGDVLKSIISDQKVLIENLNNYIMGKYL
jgi:CBS domain-containing protein